MKKLVQAAVVAALLTTGAAQADTMGTRYALDANGNLVTEQYVIPDNSGKIWKTVLIVVGGFAGIYLLGEAFDIWDDDDPAPAQQPSNGLVPTSGSSSTEWQTQFLVPTYTTVQ